MDRFFSRIFEDLDAFFEDDFDPQGNFFTNPNMAPRFGLNQHQTQKKSPRDEMLRYPDDEMLPIGGSEAQVIPNTKRDINLDESDERQDIGKPSPRPFRFFNDLSPFEGTPKNDGVKFYSHSTVRSYSKHSGTTPDGVRYEKVVENIDGKIQTKSTYYYPDGTVHTEILQNDPSNAVRDQSKLPDIKELNPDDRLGGGSWIDWLKIWTWKKD